MSGLFRAKKSAPAVVVDANKIAVEAQDVAPVETAAPAPKRQGRRLRDTFEHFLEALHDVVSDSETDSGDDADADMTKKKMAEAVAKVGDKYQRVVADRAILAKQVNEDARKLKKQEAKIAELMAQLATATSALERVAIKNEIADTKQEAFETKQAMDEKNEELKATPA